MKNSSSSSSHLPFPLSTSVNKNRNCQALHYNVKRNIRQIRERIGERIRENYPIEDSSGRKNTPRLSSDSLIRQFTYVSFFFRSLPLFQFFFFSFGPRSNISLISNDRYISYEFVSYVSRTRVHTRRWGNDGNDEQELKNLQDVMKKLVSLRNYSNLNWTCLNWV